MAGEAPPKRGRGRSPRQVLRASVKATKAYDKARREMEKAGIVPRPADRLLSEHYAEIIAFYAPQGPQPTKSTHGWNL